LISRALIVALVLCASVRAHAAPGGDTTWLVAVNTGAWFETFDQGQGGIGEQILVAKALRPHLLLGGRLTGMTELDLGNSKQNVAHVFDVGPTIGTTLDWSRLSLSASVAALLSHAKYHDGEWTTSWTAGFGFDAGVTVRPSRYVGIGLQGQQNFNRVQSATGIALRIEVALH
jgi:hypothetical protein